MLPSFVGVLPPARPQDRGTSQQKPKRSTPGVTARLRVEQGSRRFALTPTPRCVYGSTFLPASETQGANMPDTEIAPGQARQHEAQISLHKLFEPLKVGPYTLRHRVVMGPLTRSRANRAGNIPSQLNACYYAQRATAALIISEATQVSMQGQGYAWTPGIHTPEQVEGWRHVADAVHDAGGLMFMQLWHVGRISHPSLQPDEMLPVAPSAIQPKAEAFIENERGEGVVAPCVKPRALQVEEMPYLVRQYFRAARNAKAAGMDGVEVHGANGYLLDQFLLSGTNHRTDEYGGSIERRAKLLFEVIETVCEVWGPEKVGVRLSPLGTFNDMHDDDPEAETQSIWAGIFAHCESHVGSDRCGCGFHRTRGTHEPDDPPHLSWCADGRGRVRREQCGTMA
jgi:2,4-dienoyl-CoA reductase-like NADH-dependent reductase (Old Yellow Enzyme family)